MAILPGYNDDLKLTTGRGIEIFSRDVVVVVLFSVVTAFALQKYCLLPTTCSRRLTPPPSVSETTHLGICTGKTPGITNPTRTHTP